MLSVPLNVTVARMDLVFRREAAGQQVLVDAAGVAANFQRMVRIADSIGIPYDGAASEMSRQISDELKLTEFASAQHTFG